MHIGIIGGGFTGCLLAVQLLRQAPPGAAITIIERAETLGRGAAYGTDNPDHLLNVRAGNMGAFPEDPQHFHTWLKQQLAEAAPPASAFVSRKLYGAYVTDVFTRAADAYDGRARVSIVKAAATRLIPGPEPAVILGDGRSLSFDRLVLCLGNLPSGLPPISDDALTSGRYIHDPWRSQDYAQVAPGETILIIGSGLTMIDVVLTLKPGARGAKVVAVSRHGLLPHRHQDARPYAMEKPTGALADVFRTVRRHADHASEHGGDWRDVIDALRPHTVELWRGLSQAERGRFLRHVRPYWEVHRHRLAPSVAAAIDGLMASEVLSVRAARIAAIRCAAAGEGLVAELRPRGQLGPATLHASRIINCTGPEGDYTKAADALVKHALAGGVMRPDSLRLGLDVTEDGAVIDAAGNPSPTLFALGPPTRGAFWEITAVPDLRRACARMAALLLRA